MVKKWNLTFINSYLKYFVTLLYYLHIKKSHSSERLFLIIRRFSS